jgi:steroid delta-isomerase-like uncharacterized protein
MAASVSEQRQAHRLKLVDEHIDRENRHDLDGIMATFGAAARYDDEPWEAHYTSRDGVRTFYADLLRAMPDLHIDVKHRHVSETAVIVEIVVQGRHLGSWRGLRPTGRLIQFPVCSIFTFDDDDRLAGEKIYYDRATIMRQLGVFHEPESWLGHINFALMHPVTMARIVGRMIRR